MQQHLRHDLRLRAAASVIYYACYPGEGWTPVSFERAERPEAPSAQSGLAGELVRHVACRSLACSSRQEGPARNWTLDLKDRHIRVNVLSPGPTATPGLLGLAGDKATQQGLLDRLAAEVPLGRVADPDEIVSAALFLATQDTSFITGIELFADGGSAQV